MPMITGAGATEILAAAKMSEIVPTQRSRSAAYRMGFYWQLEPRNEGGIAAPGLASDYSSRGILIAYNPNLNGFPQGNCNRKRLEKPSAEG